MRDDSGLLRALKVLVRCGVCGKKLWSATPYPADWYSIACNDKDEVTVCSQVCLHKTLNRMLKEEEEE